MLLALATCLPVPHCLLAAKRRFFGCARWLDKFALVNDTNSMSYAVAHHQTVLGGLLTIVWVASVLSFAAYSVFYYSTSFNLKAQTQVQFGSGLYSSVYGVAVVVCFIDAAGFAVPPLVFEKRYSGLSADARNVVGCFITVSSVCSALVSPLSLG